MKKILLSAFTILGLAATAQTITEANHAPANNDVLFGTYQCDSTGITPGASGAGANWNFASLTEHLSMLQTFTTVTSVNAAYNPADVSVSSAANNTLYYRSMTSKLNYYGGDIAINAYDLNVKYASPAIVALYPMSLNTTTTSATSGTVSMASPAITQAFTGTCTVLADGTGTLTLPSKTFSSAIRIVTSQTISAGIAATVYLKNYDYYSPGTSKAPLFSIQTSTINAIGQPSSTQTIVTIQKNYSVVGVNEIKTSGTELSVFPNPASSVINFATANIEAIKIIAFDVTGKVVSTETMEMGKAKMNLNNLSSGVYMYRVLDKNNQVLTTGKFNVSK